MCIRRGDLRSPAGEHSSPLPCSENILMRRSLTSRFLFNSDRKAVLVFAVLCKDGHILFFQKLGDLAIIVGAAVPGLKSYVGRIVSVLGQKISFHKQIPPFLICYSILL